jgi:AraC-like DNA-binding protein
VRIAPNRSGLAQVAEATDWSVGTVAGGSALSRHDTPCPLHGIRLDEVDRSQRADHMGEIIAAVAGCRGFTNASRFNAAFPHRFSQPPADVWGGTWKR